MNDVRKVVGDLLARVVRYACEAPADPTADDKALIARANAILATLPAEGEAWYPSSDEVAARLPTGYIYDNQHSRNIIRATADLIRERGGQVGGALAQRISDIEHNIFNARHIHAHNGGIDDSPEIEQMVAERDRLMSQPTAQPAPESFQSRVQPWMLECFGTDISRDKIERNHRFLEEALELVQANGCTQSEAHQLVDYTYGRPQGEINQEAGGVMVTLAALCLASDIDMHEAGETELARIWTKVETIRAKQAAKPRHSPLPEQPAPEAAGRVVAEP